MARSANGANKLPLFALVAANVMFFCVAIGSDAIRDGGWLSAAGSLSEALPAGLGLGLIGILNAQLSSEAKSRIVFGRWRNPLPGCEAFTRYAASDPRIDLTSLERSYGPLPSDPHQQNALWYKLYKSVEDDPSVMQIHRGFLFARDYACLVLMMIIVFGTAGLLQISSVRTALSYVALLAVQFVLARRAARNSGREFVTTVLALKGAGR
jgi:hypothetical protein